MPLRDIASNIVNSVISCYNWNTIKKYLNLGVKKFGSARQNHENRIYLNWGNVKEVSYNLCLDVRRKISKRIY